MSYRSVSEVEDKTSYSSGATWSSEPDPQQNGEKPLSAQACEQRFGMEMYQDGLDIEVQRLVKQHGAEQVQRWADEGMAVETMGKPRSMEAFRDRQEERPAEVPKDIERRNAKSVQRSKGAHHAPSKAGDTQVPDSVRSVISSSGQQLDQSIQRAMEDRMGDSLGDVRVHTGPQAAKACEDINARAFTVGNHIAFNRGEYDPSSAEGQHVLAHELAHVRQQTGGAVSMLPQEGELEIDPDERLEREAAETAEQVMRGGKIGVHRMGKSDIHVQRTSSEVSVENNYSGIREIKEKLSALEEQVSGNSDDLSKLEDEVNTGWSEKAMGVMGAGVTAAATAGGRAMAQPEVQAELANTATHPEVAVPAVAAGFVSLGVAGGQEGIKSVFEQVRDRLLGADDTEEGNREEVSEGDEDGLLNKISGL